VQAPPAQQITAPDEHRRPEPFSCELRRQCHRRGGRPLAPGWAFNGWLGPVRHVTSRYFGSCAWLDLLRRNCRREPGRPRIVVRLRSGFPGPATLGIWLTARLGDRAMNDARDGLSGRKLTDASTRHSPACRILKALFGAVTIAVLLFSNAGLRRPNHSGRACLPSIVRTISWRRRFSFRWPSGDNRRRKPIWVSCSRPGSRRSAELYRSGDVVPPRRGAGDSLGAISLGLLYDRGQGVRAISSKPASGSTVDRRRTAPGA